MSECLDAESRGGDSAKKKEKNIVNHSLYLRKTKYCLEKIGIPSGYKNSAKHPGLV